MAADPAVSVFSKDFPFPALLTENRRLTKTGSAKETRHLVVNLAGSGLAYKAGDSLGVYPTNHPEVVEEILQRLGASGDELVAPAMLKLAEPIRLREALRTRLALAGPTAKFLGLLAARAGESTERAQLEAWLAPEAKSALETWLAARHFVDLLTEFPAAARALTAQEFVDQLRRLMPRLYSIASSPRLFPEEVHLTVAIVRYVSNGRGRGGVCSTYLADRVKPGVTRIPVFVAQAHFAPPETGATDAIMVGPGTGIAPFRAFVQERAASGATGRNWVFFGEQHRATDYLYEEEWAEWLARGKLTRIDTAFSRDQATKVYVQDRLREAGAEVWRWLAGGGCFYVCGDAKRMAKDVDAALHEIVARHGGMDVPAAAEYVKQMKRNRRYQRDVY